MKTFLLLSLLLFIFANAALCQDVPKDSPSKPNPYRWKLEAGVNYFTVDHSLPYAISNKPGFQLGIETKVIWFRSLSLNAGVGFSMKRYKSVNSGSYHTFDPANNIYPYDFNLADNNNILAFDLPVSIGYKISNSFSVYAGATPVWNLDVFYHRVYSYTYHKALVENTTSDQSASASPSIISERSDNIFATAGLHYLIYRRIGLNLSAGYSLYPYTRTDAVTGETFRSRVFRFNGNVSYSFGARKTWDYKQPDWKMKK